MKKKAPKSVNLSGADAPPKGESGAKFNLDAVAHPEILNPFADVTRRARRSLLLSSLVGFSISWAGLAPTEVETLGITLSGAEQNALFLLITAVLFYFLIAFWLYAKTDLVRYRMLRRAAKEDLRLNSGRVMALTEAVRKYQHDVRDGKIVTPRGKLPRMPAEVFELAEIKERLEEPSQLYRLSGFRNGFDVYVPIMCGSTCIGFLLSKTFHVPLADWKLVLASGGIVGVAIGFFALFRRRRKFRQWRVKFKGALRKTPFVLGLFVLKKAIAIVPTRSTLHSKLKSAELQLSKRYLSCVLDVGKQAILSQAPKKHGTVAPGNKQST